MRVIGGFGFDLVLGAPRLGTAGRRHARSGRRRRRLECLGGGLRLRTGIAASTLGMARFALRARGALGLMRFMFTVTRFTLTARFAAAA